MPAPRTPAGGTTQTGPVNAPLMLQRAAVSALLEVPRGPWTGNQKIEGRSPKYLPARQKTPKNKNKKTPLAEAQKAALTSSPVCVCVRVLGGVE